MHRPKRTEPPHDAVARPWRDRASEKTERFVTVAHQQNFRLLIVIPHLLVIFTADTGRFIAPKRRMRRIGVVTVEVFRTDRFHLFADTKNFVLLLPGKISGKELQFGVVHLCAPHISMKKDRGTGNTTAISRKICRVRGAFPDFRIAVQNRPSGNLRR
jgi:hypothetical protein